MNLLFLRGKVDERTQQVKRLEDLSDMWSHLASELTGDDNGVVPGTVLHDGGEYQIWYSGCKSDWRWQVGYATSADGINWAKDPANPVVKYGSPGSWDYVQAWGASVMFVEMWLTTVKSAPLAGTVPVSTGGTTSRISGMTTGRILLLSSVSMIVAAPSAITWIV